MASLPRRPQPTPAAPSGIEAASGTYVLDVQASGFQEMRRDLLIGKKPTPPLRIVLAIAAEKQVVTVNADQAVPVVSTEVSENLNANTIDRAALDRLPVFDQDYIATCRDSSTTTRSVLTASRWW